MSIPSIDTGVSITLFCNHVWAIDFLFDDLTDGRAIKIMTIEDLFSRFSVGIHCDFSISASEVVVFLEKCISLYGISKVIRTDQGPEFRSLFFQKFIQKHGIYHEFNERGKPWQNGNLESFNGKLRDECLNRNLFENQIQVKEVIEECRILYNTQRPHSGLGGKTPLEIFRYDM